MTEKKEGKMRWIIGAESPLEECITESFFEKTILSPTHTNQPHPTTPKAKAFLSYILCGRNYNDMEIHDYWTNLFKDFFLTDSQLADDLLFYVKTPSPLCHTPEVEVYRSSSTNQPSLDQSDIQWEETTYLNFILHHLDYQLTCGICCRTGEKEMQVTKKISCMVHASPSHRNLQYKETSEQMTFPLIFFTVDDFDEVFKDMTLRDTELLCIELVAKEKQHKNNNNNNKNSNNNDNNKQMYVLFVGCLRYSKLKRAFEEKNSRGQSSRSSSNTSLKVLNWLTKQPKVEYISVRGSGMKGQTQIAVTTHESITPTTFTPSLDNLHQANDDAGGGGSMGFFGSGGMGKRQMSDPHMTINRYWGGNSSSFVSGTSNSFTSSRVGNSNSISHLGGHSSSSGYFGGDDVSSRRVRSCSESQKNQDELVCSTLADELQAHHKTYPNICDLIYKTTGNTPSPTGNRASTTTGNRPSPRRKTAAAAATTKSTATTSSSAANSAANKYGSKWLQQQKLRREQSKKLCAYVTFVCLPWHQIIADLLEQRTKPVISHTYS